MNRPECSRGLDEFSHDVRAEALDLYILGEHANTPTV